MVHTCNIYPTSVLLLRPPIPGPALIELSELFLLLLLSAFFNKYLLRINFLKRQYAKPTMENIKPNNMIYSVVARWKLEGTKMPKWHVVKKPFVSNKPSKPAGHTNLANISSGACAHPQPLSSSVHGISDGSSVKHKQVQWFGFVQLPWPIINLPRRPLNNGSASCCLNDMQGFNSNCWTLSILCVPNWRTVFASAVIIHVGSLQSYPRQFGVHVQISGAVQIPPFLHRKHPSPPGVIPRQVGSKMPCTQTGMEQSDPLYPVKPK